MFWLSTLFEELDVLIRSTDTDILAIAMINHSELYLHQRNVVIHYGNSSADFTHCHLNRLLELSQQDHKLSLLQTRGLPIPRLLGALHFITGCDDLSYLRGFTKNFCMKVYTKCCDLICGESLEGCQSLFTGDVDSVKSFFTKLLICLYCDKYSQCFSSGDEKELCWQSGDEKTLGIIREKTWHKTIVTNNQLPTTTAIRLHSERISLVLEFNAGATQSEIFNTDHTS